MRFLLRRGIPTIVLCAYRGVSIAIYACSWRLLIPAQARPGFPLLFRLRWLGEAINSLLPIAQVGGDVVRARMLAARTGGATAGAAMVADLGIGVGTQALFAIAGVVAFATSRGAPHPTRTIMLGVLGALGVAGLLFLLLRKGTARLLQTGLRPWRGRLQRSWDAMTGTAVSLDAAMRELSRRPRDLAGATGWHLLGWFSHVAETWFALRIAGFPASWTVALAIESLSSTARAAAFFVPGGLGVQEGSVVYLAQMLGVPMEAAVVVALLKRVREVVVGVLGLASWAATERVSLARFTLRLLGRARGQDTHA
jgi:putative membrane protein